MQNIITASQKMEISTGTTSEWFDVVGRAVMNADRTHRYMLSRTWDASKPSVLIIGLNPSRADASYNDPTITRCVNFAGSWGYGQLFFGNLFSFRTPYPNELIAKIDTAVDDETNSHLREMIEASERVICAWGSWKFIGERSRQVFEMIPNPYCLGVNKDGQPKHPLYLPRTTQPTIYFYETRHLGA